MNGHIQVSRLYGCACGFQSSFDTRYLQAVAPAATLSLLPFVQVVKALQEAGDDERIRCVLALMGGTQQFTGLAQVQEIRQAMQTLRQVCSLCQGPTGLKSL